nr:unnamed protein product [Callosobruchus analis]
MTLVLSCLSVGLYLYHQDISSWKKCRPRMLIVFCGM